MQYKQKQKYDKITSESLAGFEKWEQEQLHLVVGNIHEMKQYVRV